MSEVTVLSIHLIVSDPDIRGGRPIIAGTTLRVQDVAVAHVFKHRTPDELATNYGISLAQVHAALAYYYEHQTEIDQQIRQDLDYGQEMREKGLGQRHPPLLR